MYIRNCPDCGKELSYSVKSCLNRAIRNNSVCISCSQKGENHPNYGKTLSEETRRRLSIAKGGNGELNHKWPGMTTWSRRVKERDDYICQHCHLDGLPEEMDAHHIIPKSKFSQYAYDLNNGQTLCKDCHRIEHNKRPNYPWGN
jgi:5-methylcytosine-specific restriction endonuclease McrA